MQSGGSDFTTGDPNSEDPKRCQTAYSKSCNVTHYELLTKAFRLEKKFTTIKDCVIMIVPGVLLFAGLIIISKSYSEPRNNPNASLPDILNSFSLLSNAPVYPTCATPFDSVLVYIRSQLNNMTAQDIEIALQALQDNRNWTPCPSPGICRRYCYLPVTPSQKSWQIHWQATPGFETCCAEKNTEATKAVYTGDWMFTA